MMIIKLFVEEGAGEGQGPPIPHNANLELRRAPYFRHFDPGASGLHLLFVRIFLSSVAGSPSGDASHPTRWFWLLTASFRATQVSLVLPCRRPSPDLEPIQVGLLARNTVSRTLRTSWPSQGCYSLKSSLRGADALEYTVNGESHV